MVKLSHSQNHTDNGHNIYLEAHHCPCTAEFTHYFFMTVLMLTEVQENRVPGKFSGLPVSSPPLCGQPSSQHHGIIMILVRALYVTSSSQWNQAVSRSFQSKRWSLFLNTSAGVGLLTHAYSWGLSRHWRHHPGGKRPAPVYMQVL